MANLKTISQKTGEFIEEDANEPGFVVNMDDDGAQAFIDRVKRENGIVAAPAPAPVKASPKSTVREAVAETGATTESAPVTSEPETVKAAVEETAKPATKKRATRRK